MARRGTTIVKLDTSPVADLKRPWQTRLRVDRTVTGNIELAYQRGYHAGLEDGMRLKARRRPPWK